VTKEGDEIMTKNRKLKNKLSLFTGIIVFICFITLMSVVLFQVYYSSKQQVQETAIIHSSRYANQITNDFTKLYHAISDFASQIETLKDDGIVSRDTATNMLKELLLNYDQAVGMGIAFESNAYDGADSRNRNVFPSDQTGRFLSYISKDASNNIKVEPLVDYEGDHVEWYAGVKRTNKAVLTEPYEYEVNGEMLVMTTIAVPIQNSKQTFDGVITVDIPLSFVQQLSEDTQVMGGFNQIVSASGIYVADSNDTDRVMTTIDQDSEISSLLSHTTDESFYEYVYSDITGDKALSVFEPIHIKGTDQYWTYISVIPHKNILAEFFQLLTLMLIITGFALIMTIVLMYLLISKITKPIVSTANTLDQMANADFTGTIPSKYLKLNDEIGRLAQSIHKMKGSISGMIGEVKIAAQSVEEVNTQTTHHMSSLMAQIEDVSATTQEMSAGMEETSASTEEMNATAQLIEQTIQNISSKANEGASEARYITERAQELKENAIASRKTASNINADLNHQLKDAIKGSKAIEKISVLSESILQITEQTNLLALNAAIEAARAGEAGKGFAVVAEEIRTLAENSNQTVNKIQVITKQVVESVENLATNSQKVIDFIDSQVIKDYEKLVSTGEQYFNDSEFVKGFMTALSTSTDDLNTSISQMLTTIAEITEANNESATGTQDIAEKSSDVAMQSSEVMEQTKTSTQHSNHLIDMMNQFNVQ